MKKKEKDTLDVICDLIMENNIDMKSYDDMAEVVDKLKSRMVQKMLDAEFDNHMGYNNNDKSEKSSDNRRNGYSSKGKKVRTPHGALTINMPRDRDGSFVPLIINKKQKVIKNEDLESCIIAMYAKGNSDNDIIELVKQIYKIDLSKEFISNIVTKVNKEVEIWRNRSIKPIYAFMYIDCLYVNIKTDMISKKRPIYNIIGIDLEGKKEVVGIWIGDSDSEGTYYWRQVFEELKTRGLKDVIYVSIDGLKGLSDAINEVYPQTKIQRCVVHLVRNLYGICSKKEAKEIITDFKKIYTSSSLNEALEEFESFKNKHNDKKKIIEKVTEYMNYIEPLFEVPNEIRKVIYTTNAVESVNSAYRKVTNGKGAFPNENAVYKIIYLRINNLEKKWSKPIKDWKIILNQLVELFGNRIIKYLEI